MKGMLKDILELKDRNQIDKDVIDFVKEFSNSNIIDIAKPSGLKGLKKYTTKFKISLLKWQGTWYTSCKSSSKI